MYSYNTSIVVGICDILFVGSCTVQTQYGEHKTVRRSDGICASSRRYAQYILTIFHGKVIGT